ncbi:MAG: hypothetical protein KDI32_08525 [Pseudomonadales bacterium]|nr:hypothetical protein [Pseudomonadales bacterium]
MQIYHTHNLRKVPLTTPKPYGIRVSLWPGDPFRKLLGADWNRLHWYASGDERDRALAEMSRKHEYSRAGDRPALAFEKIERLDQSKRL